ncbi:MAG: polysulfide reductase NrfD [Candidatus Rokubacteria bacterium]|nr:polysulfide reductase NrfD [Candidatus Rokubacteria bacterium]
MNEQVRLSLTAAYTDGHAPAAQRRAGHVTEPAPTYHGLPAIRRPQWGWHIPAYFFVGGAGSGAYIVATIADIGGRAADRPLVTGGRAVALAAMLVSPVLLVLDLGRPGRWINMLRVFRPRSMMNQGSFALLALGAFSGLGAVVEVAQRFAQRRALARWTARLGRPVSWLGALPAVVVAGYTAVLLAATNVPLWTRSRLLLGPLFLASAMSTGLAATRLAAEAAGGIAARTETRVKRAETLMTGAELALTAASVARLGRDARPLLAGGLGVLFHTGSVGLGMLAPLALARAGGRRSTLLAAALTLAGGGLLRYAVVVAGQRSADDPRAYFRATRARP